MVGNRGGGRKISKTTLMMLERALKNYTFLCLLQFTIINVHANASMHILIKVMPFRHDGITCRSHRLSSNSPMPDVENLLWSSVQGNSRDSKSIIGS